MKLREIISLYRIVFAAMLFSLSVGGQLLFAQDDPTNYRSSVDDQDLEYWLQNMVWYHQYNLDEIKAATGLEKSAIQSALKKFNITAENRPKRKAGDSLIVLPYPGGRHPRIGFMEGAVRPQQETKVSLFAPWNNSDYFVVDVPEAIWSNLGLTYLAHTHVDTIWTKQGIDMKPLEWERHSDGTFEMHRTLPNGIAFGTTVEPRKDSVLMKMWLKNGTDKILTDMRVQNCVMLKGAPDFAQLTNENKIIESPYAACKYEDGKRWVITAWDPVHRPWGNAKCPCLHSDPKFPDAKPGETKHLVGWFSFYEGEDIHAEFKRIEATGWRKK